MHDITKQCTHFIHYIDHLYLQLMYTLVYVLKCMTVLDVTGLLCTYMIKTPTYDIRHTQHDSLLYSVYMYRVKHV